MSEFSYDLHLHSCLSPCGSDDMTPATVAGLCAAAGIQIAALTDHNSCENCCAFLEAAKYYGILGIAGMELTTSEEVHVICLFRNIENALSFGEYVKKHLPKINNKPEIFGRQLVMDQEDRIIKEEDSFLAGATDISIYDVWNIVSAYNGYCYPAHIDRPSNSLLSNLGMWDDDMHFRIIELSNAADPAEIAQKHGLEKIPYIVCSDAHYMDQIMDAHQVIEISELNADNFIDKLLSITEIITDF